MAIEAFQICCLLLPPENRRKLQLLMRMMTRICLNKEMPPLCDGLGTRTLVGWFLTSNMAWVFGIKFTWVQFTSLATRGRYLADLLKEPRLRIHPDWHCAFGPRVLKNLRRSKEWVGVGSLVQRYLRYHAYCQHREKEGWTEGLRDLPRKQQPLPRSERVAKPAAYISGVKLGRSKIRSWTGQFERRKRTCISRGII